MNYEDALADGDEWADDAFDYRRWAALDGKRVRAEFNDWGSAEGVWKWKGQTGEDFYLVYILDPDGHLVVGTDPRNFETVTVLDG
jgi:hypothetical protein